MSFLNDDINYTLQNYLTSASINNLKLTCKKMFNTMTNTLGSNIFEIEYIDTSRHYNYYHMGHPYVSFQCKQCSCPFPISYDIEKLKSDILDDFKQVKNNEKYDDDNDNDNVYVCKSYIKYRTSANTIVHFNMPIKNYNDICKYTQLLYDTSEIQFNSSIDVYDLSERNTNTKRRTLDDIKHLVNFCKISIDDTTDYKSIDHKLISIENHMNAHCTRFTKILFYIKVDEFKLSSYRTKITGDTQKDCESLMSNMLDRGWLMINKNVIGYLNIKYKSRKSYEKYPQLYKNSKSPENIKEIFDTLRYYNI